MSFTYEIMLDKIRTKESFAFSRLGGDGQWQAMLGYEGGNIDGHLYFPDMAQRLREIVNAAPPYYVGMQPKALRDMGIMITTFLGQCNGSRTWCNADILHDASKRGDFDKFREAIKKRVVMAAAPIRLHAVIGGIVGIPVPARNAWLVYDWILGALTMHILSHLQQQPVIILACGMMSNVILHDLWLMFGDGITIIDAGSVFDPYAGVASRFYHVDVLNRLKEEADAKASSSRDGCPE